jgi:hypothetical protein
MPPIVRATPLVADCRQALAEAAAYAREHFEDPPAISNWTWDASPAGAIAGA